MNEDEEKFYSESIALAFSKVLQVEARCTALTATVQMLGQSHGIDPQKMKVEIDRMENTIYQKLLEQVELSSPHIAARLDRRPLDISIDEDLLSKIHFYSQDNPPN